jgi:dolichol-phosphate mannosyltransferase
VGAERDRQEKRYRSALAVDSLLLFTQLGYRFSVGMTAFMMVVSVFMMVYSIVIFATAHPVAGWTTTILFLSVVFFALFGILTIVIKYLQLLINLVFKKKQYSFEGIEKLTK